MHQCDCARLTAIEDLADHPAVVVDQLVPQLRRVVANRRQRVTVV
jgi:hypothetical protein